MTNEQLVILINDGENVADNMLQLWQQMKRLIQTISKDYIGYAEIEDLNQEGFIGLCNAVEHYDSDKNTQFSSYAVFWIKTAMRRYIFNCCSSVRLPEYAQDEMQQYRRIKADYVKVYGTEPTDREMIGLLGVNLKKYESIKRNAYISHVHSMSEPIAGDEEEILLGDSLASDQELEEDVIKKVDTAAMKNELWQTVDNLSGNMGEVLRYRYKDGLTLKESGERIGVTLERVRVIEGKAMRQLKSSTRKNQNLKLYYNQYLAMPIRHVGVREFNRTWTSSVEQTVLGWLNE